jgi:hypothetical protein
MDTVRHMDKRKKLPQEVSNYLARLGRKGSRARATALSAKRRSEIARKAAKALWSKKRRKP